jgi:NADH-quinone oxidoreductase subunit M
LRARESAQAQQQQPMSSGLPLLSLVIWLPIVAGVVVMATGSDRSAPAARWLALVGAVLGFLVALPLYTQFDPAAHGMQFEEMASWIARFHINYHLGIDGVSLLLILLNTFTTVLVVLAGWQVIETRVSQYMAAFLFLSGIMNGVFCALDGALFYVFFEATLIPMFIIIGVWGGPNRVYAAVKFFLYTLLGSLLTLIALIYLYNAAGGSFAFADWYKLKIGMTPQVLIFLAFMLAFAVKVPMWPVHTWLPDAHVEAPTGGSVVLAVVARRARREPCSRRLRHRAIADRGRVYRPGRTRADRHEEADRVFVHRAHGLRHDGHLPVQQPRCGRRGPADGLPRLRVGCAVPVCRYTV